MRYQFTRIVFLLSTYGSTLMNEKEVGLQENGWTTTIERIILSHGDSLAGRAFLHMKTHKHYRRINNRLSYPSIIITTLCGFGGGVLAFGYQNEESICDAYKTFLQRAASAFLLRWNNQDEETQIFQDLIEANVDYTAENIRLDSRTVFILQMVISFLTLGAGVLNSIQRFMKASELSEAHYTAYLSFSQLQRTLRLETALDRKDREEGSLFLASFRANLENLYKSTPSSFPEHILLDFAERFPNIEHKPDVVLEVIDRHRSKHIDVANWSDSGAASPSGVWRTMVGKIQRGTLGDRSKSLEIQDPSLRSALGDTRT